jgi:O-antigen ligase
MSQTLPRQPRSPYRLVSVLLLCCLSLVALLAWAGQRYVASYQVQYRGILPEALLELSLPVPARYGANVALQQYSSDEDLQRALGLLRAGGFVWLRQHFPWAEIEPQPGEYNWAPWDRLVAAVRGQGLELIAVLDTSPVWARAPLDRDNDLAPPQYVTTYALFARAFAQHYGEQIACYEVWDQPNLFPHWGARPVDPAAYTRLLQLAASEIRGADAGAVVLSAALSPNTEPGGRNMSEVLFLRGMYVAGARDTFDALAAKPYGFWSGPEDRRVDPQVLNFSRLILLREEMVRQGDAQKPIWAVEFGWNALPRDWQGQPAPWGTDDVAKQADRTFRAVQRARQDWGWLGLLCWASFQPAAPADDPTWGFALVGDDAQPTPFYATLQQAIATPFPRVAADLTSYHLRLAASVGASLLLLVVSLCLAARLPWSSWLAGMAAAYRSMPEVVQWLLPGLLLVAYYVLPWAVPSLLLLALCFAFFLLRLDVGLGYLVFSIPFFLYPKTIAGKAFSLVETLTLLCLAAWAVQWLSREILVDGLRAAPGRLWRWLWAWRSSWTGLDGAVAVFVLLAGFSLLFSQHRGVSLREFRVVIFEPAILYFLLRQGGLQRQQLLGLADALLLAGVAVCLFGLYRYLVLGDFVLAEGVRRLRAVYASPNNLSLLLGRILPLAFAVLWAGRPRRRYAYGLALLPLLLCLFLTYSRGGWLLSLPAGLLAIGWLRGRRTTLLVLLVLLLCLAVLLPVMGRQRFLSLLDFEQGTTFRRLKLWEAAWHMIQDYPLTGVGLDNFLYEYPNYMLPEAWQEPGLSHPHNLLLDFWTRLGLGGLLVLVWLLAAFFSLALRLYRRLPEGNESAIILGWVASLAAMLAHGLIDNSYFLVDLAFIFFLSLGWTRALQIELSKPIAPDQTTT